MTTEVWNKTNHNGTNQIVVPDQAWEAGSVYEPQLPNGNIKQLWYSYGWNSPGLAYVPSPDGYVYPSAGKIKVFGNGAVIPGPAWHARIQQKSDGTFRLTYNASELAPSDLMVSYSPDGLTGWTTPTVLIAHDSYFPGIFGGYVLPFNGEFIRLFAMPPAYDAYYAVGPTEDGPWTKTPPVQMPRPGGTQFANGFFSPGPPVIVNGVYHSWANGATVGLNPSDLYHCCSTDLVHWQIGNGGAPVITKTLAWERNDQVADAWTAPVTLNIGGVNYSYVYLYYDAVDNANQWASIGVAWHQGDITTLPCP